MKLRLTLLMVLIASILSCTDEDFSIQKAGLISFVIPVSQSIGETPALIISVEDKNGKSILQEKLLSLTLKNQQYTTEEIYLGNGEYHLTKFIVVSNNEATYATPRSGSLKATLIDKPLPLEFQVASSKPTLAPPLVGIAAQDTPELFGYNHFVYDDIENPSEEWMDVRVKFELTIGKIYYPEIDAEFIVKAYNESDEEQWNATFTYTGPESNDLRIKSGFYRYRFQAKKWGVSTEQVMMGDDLWNDRVREGAVPVTHVFSKTIEAKKVSSYVRSSQQTVNGEKIMRGDSKAVFEYDAGGNVKQIDYFLYSWPSGAIVPDKRSEFTYSGNNVSKIITYEAGTNRVIAEDNYVYDAAGYASHIQHKEYGITTDVALTYAFTDRVATATYSNSNGTGFSYEMVVQSGNVKKDRTNMGSQTCNNGAYSYDKHINPLRHLGYIDFLLRNYSVSNRTTEDVTYIGCAFPSLVPESFSYTYTNDGYPLVATTVYKGSGHKSQVEYSY